MAELSYCLALNATFRLVGNVINMFPAKNGTRGSRPEVLDACTPIFLYKTGPLNIVPCGSLALVGALPTPLASTYIDTLPHYSGPLLFVMCLKCKWLSFLLGTCSLIPLLMQTVHIFVRYIYLLFVQARAPNNVFPR